MVQIDFQKIYEIIAITLPNDWDKIVVNCVFWGESCEVRYYVKSSSSGYIDCFELPMPYNEMFIVMTRLIEVFTKNTHDWKSLTMIINVDGTFNVEPDYSNSTDDYEMYLADWEKKYLE